MAQVTAIIEIPSGTRNRYQLDHASGAIFLDRCLATSMRYPADYGVIEGTTAEDGAPLDVLVVVSEPTFPGCRIRVRPVALLAMTDENGPGAKLLALPAWETALGWQDLPDVPGALLLEITHFFSRYKELEPDQGVAIGGWMDRAAAERELAASQTRFTASR